MQKYLKNEAMGVVPRLPLEGSLDLTYRCNNNCRHCWLRTPPGSQELQNELSAEEIMAIFDEARKLGCRSWNISGGEPMTRPDFAEIFDYITRRSFSYTLNTNGTLITPEIAQLMRRKGTNLVALYGATAEVHDHITRNKGSFDAVVKGFSTLVEEGADFTVQLVPMRDNYHQLDEMVCLARSLSPSWRVGAAWLYLSASGDQDRNEEIRNMRLDASEVIELDRPDITYDEGIEREYWYNHLADDDRLFASCISKRRGFHIDPYGGMTFCDFIKDPALRYDLRKGCFEECWEEFIPSIVDKVRGGQEYRDNCGSCDLRDNCRWCPVYGYLEHRRFSAKVEYLCSVARESHKFKVDWKKNHRRYYQIGGITIQVDSDLPFTESTFHPKFRAFEIEGPGEDTVFIRHHFSLPDLEDRDLGEEVYHNLPWIIHKKGNSWIYEGSVHRTHHIDRVAVFNREHTRARVYHDGQERFLRGGLESLANIITDQIFLARLLSDREGCILHSSGVILDGKGLLFVGHSGAGKSTIVKMLTGMAEILCDDRNILKRLPEGFRVYGTWSHGEVPVVSAASAPLKSILFLEKAEENRLIKIENSREVAGRLLGCLIKPLTTADWWEKSLSLVEKIVREVPCYRLQFDESGGVVDLLRDI